MAMEKICPSSSALCTNSIFLASVGSSLWSSPVCYTQFNFRSALRHNSLPAALLYGVEPHVVGCHVLLLSPRNDAERIVGQRAL